MTDVKYVVAPLERACVVQIYVPISRAAMTAEHGTRLDLACEEARQRLERERDSIAAELHSRGICPWCNELSHPESQRCLA